MENSEILGGVLLASSTSPFVLEFASVICGTREILV